MKQRFSSLDVQIIAHELSNSLVSLRLANIYDLSSRIFLLKFAKPEHREQLLIDSGFRCHLTAFARSTAAAPTAFVARLRKFLRTRRCTKVAQVGTDRVIELQFSDGTYRLFLEFYAGGNIILTDSDLVILSLLRTVNEGAEHEQYRQGLKYQLEFRQNYDGVPELTKQRIKDGLERAVEKQEAEAQKPGKKIKKKGGDQLRKALAVTTHEFPPVLLDHALKITGYDREILPGDVIANEALLDKLMTSLEEAKRVVQEITSHDSAKGYIIAKRKSSNSSEQFEDGGVDGVAQPGNLMYEDFHPFKPAQIAEDPGLTFLEFDGFNKTADEFFSSLEGQKLESRLQEREDNAKRKIEAARQEQARRIDGLQQVQELNVRKAQAIEANVERVEEAAAAVNGLIAQGMDWVDIGRLIENEQSRNNPVAQTVKLPLKLNENTVTLLLHEYDVAQEDEMADETDSDASDSETESTTNASTIRAQDNRLAVDIDLMESAGSNARHYYDQKRTAAAKQEKTAQASQKALKSTEQKVMGDLKKGLKQEKDVLRPVRKQFWFEKFIYFISSDGYLVLAGKDAQQNETLYRRYLRKGDIYIHADLHGAASVVIKNNANTPDAPIPPSTLGQAGNLAVCTSSAWDSKAVMSAWWVEAEQVSKTAPTGEYLTTGGFMIRGKKNFLPPAQLLLGFAIMFQISEESKARHIKHRLKDADRPDTPELTDAETIAESSIVGDDSGGNTSDDDFPDAVPGPAAAAGVDDDDVDDDFPDVAEQPNDAEANDVNPTDIEANHELDSDDEESFRANPLQSKVNHGKSDEETGKHSDLDTGLDRPDDVTSVQAEVDDADDEVDDAPDTDQNHPDKLIDQNEDTDEVKESKKHSSAHSQTPHSKQKAAHQVRGKKGKAKKIAAKYADQDEEDRETAMKLLGSRNAREKREAEGAEKAAKAESAELARARRREQHEKKQKEGLEAEEIRRLNLDEGIEELGEEESSALTQLDSLIGTPLPGDEILEAIPICAPWSALAKFKYKIKLQPGQQKKGKAVREILAKFAKETSTNKALDHHSQDTEKIWPREAELIKAWKEPEVIGVIPVKSVRVMMPGGGSTAKGGAKAKGGKRGKGSKKK